MNMPTATYRLQFNKEFTIKQATDLVEYLNDLGISHCYASPLLCCKKDSKHGYDIIDHSKLNHEVGTFQELAAYTKALRSYKMGLILDIVPNHMYIVDFANHWWNNILENGPSSPYADYFDIDWSAGRESMHNKVLLPLLDQQYGEALENQVPQIIYKEGSFLVQLPNVFLPTDPSSWLILLEPISEYVQEVLPLQHPDVQELESILTALKHLPPITTKELDEIAERQREKEIIKRRLCDLVNLNPTIFKSITHHLSSLNGIKNDPHSVDRLEEFLKIQPYRLSFWRVANEEINYRRFFDVFEFAGIRMENPKVFEATHVLIFELIQKQLIDGIRIDHIDGLWNPEEYLKLFQARCKRLLGKPEDFYVIVEKILIGNEKTPEEWLCEGTVGYDFLNQINQFYVCQTSRKNFQTIYRDYTGIHTKMRDEIYFCKNLILSVSMSSELNMLSHHLDKISQQHRNSRDLTVGSLKSALREIIACFPVYRSYIQSSRGIIHTEDQQTILHAIARAKLMNASTESSIFDFVKSILLQQHPAGITVEQRIERENFVMRFQQLTGPVMAKGAEDTAYYRYYPLCSINEVGSDLNTFGISIETFHQQNLERAQHSPYTMTTTNTHDSKRSEDVRARINVLSETPEEWDQNIKHWMEINQVHKTEENSELIPDKNEEYLFYQTVVGTWPTQQMTVNEHQNYVNRIQAYMEKAIKEAKIHTSWINPNKKYEEDTHLFIQKVLEQNAENSFLDSLSNFISKIAPAGFLNSLSQLLLKTTSPGIPDFYQGSEIWDFNLVDPDNRHPVDFSKRTAFLNDLRIKNSNNLQQLINTLDDGKIKLFMTLRALEMRKKFSDVFLDGDYKPLNVEGNRKQNVIAFSRTYGKKNIIVISTRFFLSLLDENGKIDPGTWINTCVQLPAELSSNSWMDVFSKQKFTPQKNNGQEKLSLDKTLNIIPFAMLENI